MSKREKENINVKEVSNKQGAKKALRHEWQQTESEVTIILYPGNSKVNYNLENVKFKSTESNCSIIFQDNRTWSCDLYRVVVPEGTSIQFKSNKVILKMVKKAPESWKQLEARKKDEMSEDSAESPEPKIGSEIYSKENKEAEKPKEKHIVEVQNLNYTFYQKNLESLTVDVYVKQIKKDDLSMNFEENKFSLTFKTSDTQFLNNYINTDATPDTTFVWSIYLKAPIKPKQCRFKLSEKKLEITLEKETPYRWSGLEGSQPDNQFKAPSTSWVPIVKPELSENQNSLRESLEQPNIATSSVITENSLEHLYNEDIVSDCKKESKPTCLVSPLNKNQIVGQLKYGLTGLDNLGNTCFMNSVLQCLANTSELKEYFLSGRFQQDINVENPLSLNGHLAVTFAVLLKNLWMGVQHSYAPSKLKMLIGQKVTQFSGFAQHDSQEFMAFFLDGLHEDLNRVKQKPYIESSNLDDKPDEVAANECWQNYKKRNDSIVVDLFQGQYKSKLVCPTCSKVSITFDPFLYLSLPLPKNNCVITVYFFSKDPRRKPRKYSLKVSVDSYYSDLKAELSSKVNVPPDKLRGFLVSKREPIQPLVDHFHLTYVNYSGNSKIFMFEVFDSKLVGEPIIELTVVQRLLVPELKNECSFCSKASSISEAKLKRCTKCMRVAYCGVDCQRSHWPDHKSNCVEEPHLMGSPFFISIPKSQATYSVIARLLEAYSRHSVDVFQPPVDYQSAKLNQSFDSLSSPNLEDVDSPLAISSESSSDIDDETRNRIDTEKAMSEMDIGTDLKNEGASSSGGSMGQQPVRLVIGQQSEKDHRYDFVIVPVDKNGRSLTKNGAEVLEDKGSEPLDLINYKHIAMDWKNNHRSCPNYVMVQSKELDCEDDDDEVTNLDPNLDDCLRLFTEPEVLTNKNSWYCPSCKEHREATKQLSLWRLPPVLIIQLKRFSYGGLLHFREKLDKMIDFPIRSLDLSPYLCKEPVSEDAPPPIYDLYGVVNHEGGIFGGHYTSFARLLDPCETRRSVIDWRLFDDSRVSFVSESSIVTEAAYLLFYRQRNKPFTIERRETIPVVVGNTFIDDEESDDPDTSSELDLTKELMSDGIIRSDNSEVDMLD